MKPIIIKESNRERIEAILSEVQGKSRERTVSVKEIMAVPGAIRSAYGISMSALEGCSFELDLNARYFAKAYKYVPMSTHIFAEVSKGSFKLTDIKRTNCWTGSSTIVAVLTDTAKEALIEHFQRFDLRI